MLNRIFRIALAVLTAFIVFLPTTAAFADDAKVDAKVEAAKVEAAKVEAKVEAEVEAKVEAAKVEAAKVEAKVDAEVEAKVEAAKVEAAKVEAKVDAKVDAMVEEPTLAVRAAAVLEHQLAQDADKRIPRKLRDDAQCVAVFPSVVEGGFIVAVKRGHGVVSCRGESGHWGAPAVVNLSAASVGLQAGIQKASIIMMFMKDKAVENLLDGGKMSAGAGIDIAAGPVGSDVNLDSQPAVVSYSRSKGLFAGVSLEGAKVGFAKKVNAEYYGEDVTGRDVLRGDLESAEALKSFHDVLSKFAEHS